MSSSGNTFENIFALGQGQIDDYERRFLAGVKADSDLQIAEIGYGLSNTLANLPGGFMAPEFFDPFKKQGKQGTSLFNRISRRIA